MAEHPVMTKARRLKLNQHLADLEAIEADIATAKKAQVPGVDQCDQSCQDLKRRILAMKSAYYPDQR